jgi:hypothetical protein
MHIVVEDIQRDGLVRMRRQTEALRILFKRDSSDVERASAIDEHRRLSEILSAKYEGYKSGYEAGSVPDPCVPWHILYIQKRNTFFVWQARHIARQASVRTFEYQHHADLLALDWLRTSASRC